MLIRGNRLLRRWYKPLLFALAFGLVFMLLGQAFAGGQGLDFAQPMGAFQATLCNLALQMRTTLAVGVVAAVCIIGIVLLIMRNSSGWGWLGSGIFGGLALLTIP